MKCAKEPWTDQIRDNNSWWIWAHEWTVCDEDSLYIILILVCWPTITFSYWLTLFPVTPCHPVCSSVGASWYICTVIFSSAITTCVHVYGTCVSSLHMNQTAIHAWSKLRKTDTSLVWQELCLSVNMIAWLELQFYFLNFFFDTLWAGVPYTYMYLLVGWHMHNMCDLQLCITSQSHSLLLCILIALQVWDLCWTLEPTVPMLTRYMCSATPWAW